MNKTFWLNITAVILLMLMLVSCKVDVNKSSDKEITSYWFTSSKNSTLSETIKCSISGTNITCSTPYGTDVTGLIATFQQTGEKVIVGNTEQTSGSTANDFSSSVAYTVIAEDDSTQEYEVTVSVADASDKTINSFEFLAENNTALSADVTGTVYENNHTIGASVPSGTDVTALCPTIGYSGDSVSPGNEVDTDFTNPVTYTVSAADGSTRDYTATVSVFTSDSNDEGSGTDTVVPSISISNIVNHSTVESGFIIGTASDNNSVASVEVKINSGSYSSANGTTSWIYQLPTGTSTLKHRSEHTLYFRSKDNSGNYSDIRSFTIRKGHNKDVNGDGYSDFAVGTDAYNSSTGRAYLFLGSSSGLTTMNASSADSIFTGENANDKFYLDLGILTV